MSSLAEILSTPHHRKKPTKPKSGYNMFYADQTKRVRKRLAALRLFEERVVQPGSSSDPMEIAATIGENVATFDCRHEIMNFNATVYIGGKWKSFSKEVKDLYELRGDAERKRYNADKTCWTALDNLTGSPSTISYIVDDSCILLTANGKTTGKKTMTCLPRPKASTIQSGLPDSGAFVHGIHEGNEKYRHLVICLI